MRRALLVVVVASACGRVGFSNDEETPEVAPDAALSPGVASGSMTRIEAGPFVMGCDHDPDPTLNQCEWFAEPSHEVTLSTYWLDVTEVSRAAYAACVADGACTPGDPAERACTDGSDDLPVACITWDQASDYCAFAGKRLPTEAEFEKAARGGDARRHPWGETFPNCDLATFRDCQLPGPLPIVSHRAGIGPHGELNLAGNVAEWVGDYYADDAYSSNDAVDPHGPRTGTDRVVRGGHFDNGASFLRGVTRTHTVPWMAEPTIGVRCALTAP